jgi:predicted GIY-YIG superfamily endonuclease
LHTVVDEWALQERAMSKTSFVYIISNKSLRLDTGITSDAVAGAFQHKNKWHEKSFRGWHRFDMF